MNGNAILSRIVLASASPRRLELLRSLGLSVEVAPSGYDERASADLTPSELATYHAGEKLRAALRNRAGHANDVPVIAADTVVDLDGVALGKPGGADEAAGMLHALWGREHLAHGVCAGRSRWRRSDR